MNIELSRLKTALTAHLDRNEIVSNNLANSRTIAYKRDVTFMDILEENTHNSVRTAVQTDRSQGGLEQTDNPLDIAVSGEGMFLLEKDGEQFLSRDGHFSLDSRGYLMNSAGYNVIGQNGRVYLSLDGMQTGNIQISQDGQIFIDDMPMATLRIIQVHNPETLLRAESNMYRMTEETITDDIGSPTLLQGSLEQSNVDPVAEMINLIDLQRQFESIQKTVQTLDDALGNAVNKVGNY